MCSCDATYLKGRVGGQVVSRAVVVATGITMTATGKSSAWRWVTAKTRRSGPSSCARCGPEA